MKKTFRLFGSKAAALTLLAFAACQAHAVDWGGYFRAGPGASKKDASRACYGLNGPGLKYRLGNECDIYGEFFLSQGMKAEGVDYKAFLMTNLFNPQTDTGSATTGINQMYVEGKGFDIAPNTNFWIGKRFYGRADVHIVDTFFTNLSGVGAGADIPVGLGTLGVAYFHTDASATASGNRLNFDWSGFEINPRGKLRVLGTITQGHFSGGKSGAAITVQHNQDIRRIGALQQKDVLEELDEGGNTFWLQYAQGSAGLNGNFGDLTAGSDVKSWRAVESVSWQKGRLGGQAMVMFQQDKSNATGKVDSGSLGGRVSWAFTKNFKLLAELGYSQKKPDGGPTQKLTKFTIAPTLSTGPGFFNRPELRVYVTSAKWNDAANAAAGPDGLIGVPGTGTKTSGTSYGAQVEIWF
jgi:maltoporin